MPAFLISYRIHSENPQHKALGEHIRELSKPKASHPFNNTWIIESRLEDAQSVKKTFEGKFTFDSIDQLLVIRISDLSEKPNWDGVNIDEDARLILEHDPKKFADVDAIEDGLEASKQRVFFVSCDHSESNTDKIEQALRRLRGTHEPTTTSSWLLVLKKSAGADDLFTPIQNAVIRAGGQGLTGLVIQLTREIIDTNPAVRVLHTLAAKEQEALTNILALHKR